MGSFARARSWSSSTNGSNNSGGNYHQRHNSSSAYDKPLPVQLLESANRLRRHAFRAFRRLNLLQQTVLVLALLAALALGILFLVYNESIFAWLEPYAERWKLITGGWAILWVLTFFSAIPPLIGYSTCVTTAGFIYGFPNGWFIAASANVIGSTAAFLISRHYLSGFANRLVARDSRFAALSLVLKHDGLKLLIMIRMCPLPYSLSNGAISTIQTVSATNFAIATAVAAPKLLIHVFVGSRLAEIARSGQHGMDFGTKVVNWTSIAFGVLLGVITGWIIFRRTVARARQLEAEEERKLEQRLPLASAGAGAGAGTPSARRSGELQDPSAFATALDEEDYSAELSDSIELAEEGGRRYRDDDIPREPQSSGGS